MVLGRAAAAAAGLQCAQIKILKPRPQQLVQIVFLRICQYVEIGLLYRQGRYIPRSIAGATLACNDGSSADAGDVIRVESED